VEKRENKRVERISNIFPLKKTKLKDREFNNITTIHRDKIY